VNFRRRALRIIITGLAGAVAAAVVAPAVSSTGPAASATPSEWTLTSTSDNSTLAYNQGLATGGGLLHGRGYLTIRPELAAEGWTHIGDQDIYRSETYDAYENLDAGRKLYAVTGRDGAVRRYYHRLAPGELANNSFVTVDPSGKYLVSGEWKVQKRLLVFANPRAQRSGSQVPLVGQINLDQPLENVQSCDFVDATRLVCAVDKPRQAVYSVWLSRPLTSGTTVTGRVTHDFDVPKHSACKGGYEVEGIDYDARRKLLSVGIIDPSPCLLNTKVFRYARR